MPSQKPKPIIILGMHRSGTSCLAGALQQAGLYLGEVSEANKYNQKGNRENNSVMSLNEAILSYNGGSWDKIPDQIEWLEEHEEQALYIIDSYNSSCEFFWGFKDPRTVLTYPFWKTILPDAQLVGTFRHPSRVVDSLKNRDTNITSAQALELWFSYNTNLLKIYNLTPFPIISFDLPNTAYKENLRSIIDTIGLTNNIKMDFFDDDLRTIKPLPHTENIKTKIIDIFNALNDYSVRNNIHLNL